MAGPRLAPSYAARALALFLVMLSVSVFSERIGVPAALLQELTLRLTASASQLDGVATNIRPLVHRLTTVESSLTGLSLEMARLSTTLLSEELWGSGSMSADCVERRNVLASVGSSLTGLSLRLLEASLGITHLLNDLRSLLDTIKGVSEAITAGLHNLGNVVSSTSVARNLRLDQGYVLYVVKSGDNLTSIARAFRTTVEQIARASGLSDGSRLFVGQPLRIPVEDPSSLVRFPVKFQAGDVLLFHGQEVNGSRFTGVRIAAGGRDVFPMMPGRVLESDGTRVVIDHGNMVTSVYRGLGATVRSGTFVSIDRSLGTCSGNLDFEVYIEGEPRDPLRILFEHAGTFTVTFYSEWDDGKIPAHPTFRITRSGAIATPNRTIAVDPTVIPLGSLVYVPTLASTVFVAEDTGSAIKGNRLDVYTPDVRTALAMGVSFHPVYVFRLGM